jgi:hypothetical protein
MTNCRRCNVEFRVGRERLLQKRAPFCSRKCQYVFASCAKCGTQFRRKPSHIGRKGASVSYCSKVCSNQANAKRGPESPTFKVGKTAMYCAICGVFVRNGYPSAKAIDTVCSKACDNEHKSRRLSGAGCWNYNGGKQPVPCGQCGATVLRARSEIAEYERMFCNMKCAAKWRSEHIVGPAHPNWQGGKSFEPYPTTWTFKLREAIRNRDGRRCRLCAKTEAANGARLSVHHVDYDKDNLKPDNLVSLCIRCHVKTNFVRPSWTELFKAAA